jgi:putative ABC transport system substrate-binding protein
MIRRREFITLLGGAAAAWPLAARAQQGKRMPRVGALMPYAENDPQVQARNMAFLQELQHLGWTIGRNVEIDYRWSAGRDDDTQKYAAELVALAPDVIFVSGKGLAPLQRATSTVPIVFALVPDPVGSGFVESLAQPGGNITGFMPFEYGIGGKWLELLKEMVPNITRAAVVRDPAITAGIGQWAAIASVSRSVGIEVSPVNVVSAGEIERAIMTFARKERGGLIVTGSSVAVAHRDLIIALAARHRLPAIYSDQFYAVAGGLMAYGPNDVEQFRLAATYVDRILRGEKPADLPVQAPTRYELAINLKTARALGLTVPQTLLVAADEVIE